MLTTTTVIGMIYKPDGQPAAGAVVNVDLNRPDTDSATGIVVPAKLSFIAAAVAEQSRDHREPVRCSCRRRQLLPRYHHRPGS